MAKSRSIGGVYASLSLRDKGFKSGLSSASKRLSAFAKSAPGQITGALSFAGVIAGASSAVTAASDLYETVSKSQTVFGESAKSMEAWASTASDTFGQSKSQALGAAATMGNMFVAMGMGGEASAGMSRNLVELAADLASFNNTSSDDALEALGAALRGESEPIRRYGVLLDDATLKAEALSRGIYDGKGSLEPASRAMAAYGVILKQTATAQGDFAKTADGLANSQRTITAKLEESKAALGESLLPLVQDLANSLKEIDFEATASGIGKVVSKTSEWAENLAKVAKYMPLSMVINGAAESIFGGDADPDEAKRMADEWAKNDPLNGKPTVKDPYYRDSQAAADDSESIKWFQNGGFAEAMRGVNGAGSTVDETPELLKRIDDKFTEEIPGWLKRQDDDGRSPMDTSREVNDYQSRGLSLDPSGKGRATEDQVSLLQAIRDILKSAKTTKQLNW